MAPVLRRCDCGYADAPLAPKPDPYCPRCGEKLILEWDEQGDWDEPDDREDEFNDCPLDEADLI